MLKRFGCGYASSEMTVDDEGALVLDCPACPMPGKNMPENWEVQFKDEPYVLYRYNMSG